jgi:hypothetical protein
MPSNGNVFTEPLPRNGRCLQSHCLATDLYATVLCGRKFHHIKPWWWKRKEFPKRLTVTPYEHGWSPEKRFSFLTTLFSYRRSGILCRRVIPSLVPMRASLQKHATDCPAISLVTPRARTGRRLLVPCLAHSRDLSEVERHLSRETPTVLSFSSLPVSLIDSGFTFHHFTQIGW